MLNEPFHQLWQSHIEPRAADMKLREFRTVHGNKLIAAVFADDPHLSKQTLSNIKFLLSGIFKYAKNQGFHDGENPITDVMIPEEARGPSKTYAHPLPEILRILDVLPLQPKAAVAVAAFAGLREGEIVGLDWTDYDRLSDVRSLNVSKSVWRGHARRPKTLASEDDVPVIEPLAIILDEYRESMGNPQMGPMFVAERGSLLDLDKVGRRVICPAIRTIGVSWHGWHAFRRGIASNLFALGVNEKIVQRILRHSKPQVTRERYIKAFDPDVIAAMKKMEATIAQLRSPHETNKRQWN
jgi:integrase